MIMEFVLRWTLVIHLQVGQLLKAVWTDGIIALAGLLGVGTGTHVRSLVMDPLSHLCISRGFLLSIGMQFREMKRFMDKGNQVCRWCEAL
ncbi:hypothetical protein BJY01DRAFT_216960 [Aspergillus pseudoustus]|uniref:Uncharacterized protein n=1 Tax=Aspergillus pseudoustus TaxID=1810923 RepID=A0ABR4JPU5_9EURO